jgi:hypothetical protein
MTFIVRTNKDKTLLAGPWIGEFGWELFCWQGYIRSIAHEYGKVIVASRAGHELLYEDFANEFVPVQVPENASSNSWWCDGLPESFTRDIASKIKHDIRIPAKYIGFLYYDNGTIQVSDEYLNQKFIKYHSDSLNKTFDILIHPRNKSLGNERNWNKNSWQNLVDLLSKKFTVAVIGNHEAFQLNNAEDYRKLSIRDTVSLMNRCKLVVGQSSGPLHLASLSGASHLIWSTEHNRNRYTKYWNPFGIPAYFYSEMGWNPSVDFIYNKIIENIK